MRRSAAAASRPGQDAPSSTEATASGGEGAAGPIVALVPLHLASIGNRREHWRARVRRTRREIAAVLGALGGRKPPPLPAVILLVRIGWNRLDVDGLVASVKGPIDALARWCGVDDRDRRLHWHLAECIVPRSKTGTPQALAIPDALAPFLRAWWERAGKPEAGPVFPSRLGKRAGDFRGTRGQSFAKRLRRELFRAGVFRMTPIEVPAIRPGQRTDLGRGTEGTKLAPNPRDPLYFETATTLPVDWHSFRRAFASALAEAGVNVQHAMHLASHSDPRVHARYVMRTAAMRAIPDAALPPLPNGALPEAPKGAGIVTARDDSPRLSSLVAEKANDSGAGHGSRTRDLRLGRRRYDVRS